jgi:hypothetical protein
MPAIGEKPAPPRAKSRAETLLARYHDVRDFSKLLVRDLEPEDCVVQSIPDVSPTKWHLAHTTWFFETFVLKKFLAGYIPAIPEYAFLFNSYYNAAGTMHRRDLRGLISRPTVTESFRYRENIDGHMEDLVASAADELLDEIEPVIVLGLHHKIRSIRFFENARNEGPHRRRRFVSSISTKQSRLSATAAVDFPTITKDHSIALLFRNFRWARA